MKHQHVQKQVKKRDKALVSANEAGKAGSRFCPINAGKCDFPVSFSHSSCLTCFGRKAIRKALKE
jgi:hypothetical protein